MIAGYPWFLDWGRDTFICARGLLAAGMTEEVRQLLLTFGRFERDGTLPNTIFGEDASNRDTSDAPLWFGLVCEELGADLDSLSPVPGRTIRNVLESIALNYIKGTPNGIRMDPALGPRLEPEPLYLDGHQLPGVHAARGLSGGNPSALDSAVASTGVLSKASERDRWEKLADPGSSLAREDSFGGKKKVTTRTCCVADRWATGGIGNRGRCASEQLFARGKPGTVNR